MNKKFVYQVGNNKKVVHSSLWWCIEDGSMLMVAVH